MTERRTATKKCARCGLVKPLEAFYRYSKGKLGRTSRCKACHGVEGPVEAKEAQRRPTRQLRDAPGWQAYALCRDVINGDWVDIPNGGRTRLRREKEMELKICGVCTVQAECLEYALEYREPRGIWGGRLPAERRKIQQRRMENA